MIIDVVTLFPSMFSGVVGESILKRAQEGGQVKINLINLRSFSKDKHKKVDDAPYGGGPGMVIMAEPVFDAVEQLRKDGREDSFLVLLTPGGVRFDQTLAQELSKQKGLILLCGHYEGIDERVMRYVDQEISIGDYVLTGGELPAMVVIDAWARLVPGVVGDPDSVKNESFTTGFLDHPHYTRPSAWRGQKVPDALLSGNHREIEAWRKNAAVRQTNLKRPKLLRKKL